MTTQDVTTPPRPDGPTAHHRDVVVVGAGQAGLAIGCELQRQVRRKIRKNKKEK